MTSSGNSVVAPTLRAGFVDITPNGEEALFGFQSRRGAYEDVCDRLEVNGALLGDGENNALFLSFDLLYVGPALSESLKTYCSRKYALDPAGVLLSASHTHFAPSTDDTKPLLGETNPAYVASVDAAAKRLVDDLFAAAPQTVQLNLGRGASDAAVNRRLMHWTAGRDGFHYRCVTAPNRRGPVNREIHVITARSRADLAAVFWNFACHPVSFPRQSCVSSDFAGRVRSAVRAHAGANIPVIFWQGFSGDLRPCIFQTHLSLRDRARNLLRGPSFGSFTGEEWNRWADTLSREVLRATESAQGGPAITGRIASRACAMPLTELFSQPNRIAELEFQRIDLGDVTIFGASAEFVTEYVERTRQRLNTKQVICVGCAGPVYGYFPTAAQIAEGGYECDEFRKYFSIAGDFKAAPESVLDRALEALA